VLKDWVRCLVVSLVPFAGEAYSRHLLSESLNSWEYTTMREWGQNISSILWKTESRMYWPLCPQSQVLPGGQPGWERPYSISHQKKASESPSSLQGEGMKTIPLPQGEKKGMKKGRAEERKKIEQMKWNHLKETGYWRGAQASWLFL
jgi:hypothetical protein